MTSGMFWIFRDKNRDKWHWHLKLGKAIISASGEGHDQKEDCEKEINLIKKLARDAVVEGENE